MEGYTGEGEPPCIVMTLRAESKETTPPDLQLTVTLTGVRGPNTITLERKAERALGEYFPLNQESSGWYSFTLFSSEINLINLGMADYVTGLQSSPQT